MYVSNVLKLNMTLNTATNISNKQRKGYYIYNLFSFWGN